MAEAAVCRSGSGNEPNKVQSVRRGPLESGLDDRGSWSWAGIQDELSQISRVCAYDRAGMLWSEPREGPRDAERIAGELHAILAAASEAPPYVMVGHSLGGLLVRVYDERYPGEALGFVFVDASHPEQERRFPAEVRELMKGAQSDPPWALQDLLLRTGSSPASARPPGRRTGGAAFPKASWGSLPRPTLSSSRRPAQARLGIAPWSFLPQA